MGSIGADGFDVADGVDAADPVDWEHNGAVCDDVFRWLAGDKGVSREDARIGDAVDTLRSGTSPQRARAAGT